MVKITFDDTNIAPPIPKEDLIFTVTPAASARLQTVFAKKETTVALQINVLGGGCNGYSYQFKLVDTIPEAAFTFTHATNPNAKVILNENSLRLLNDCTLDFVETAEASQFVIQNPHAKSSCGCGNSFGY